MSANLAPHALRKLVSLALVATFCTPLVLTTKRVRVSVDGGVRQVRSFGDTVGDVLARKGIDVSPADHVVPALDTPLEDGARIRIVRAIAVRLVAQDGSSRHVLTPDRSLAGVMQAASLDGARPVLPFRGPLDDGDVVRVRIPMPITVSVDGGTVAFDSTAATLGEALGQRGLSVGADDIVTPSLTTPVDAPLDVTITRIASREEVEEVPLPFQEERRETDALLRGTTRVVVAGVEGLRRDVYEVRVVDGEDVERTLVSSEVVREPQDRVVEVGTREPPPPTPADDDRVWYRLAACESGGRWSYDGAYDGGLQFHPDTWRRWKPSGYPEYAWQASPAQQITVGKRLHAVRGWKPWPSCSRKLGLR